nr:chemokine-like protein TAFA-5 isoform X4 [Peromyscus maniculatus bairdii]
MGHTSSRPAGNHITLNSAVLENYLYSLLEDTSMYRPISLLEGIWTTSIWIIRERCPRHLEPSVAIAQKGLLTIAAPAVPLGVAVAPWRLYTSAAALHPSWTPPVLHLPTVSQRPDKDSPIPRSPELKSVQLNPGGQDSDTQGVVPGISNTWYVEPGRTHPP